LSDNGLLTIGEFAGRSRLSIKALRLYDRTGLLRPADVDPVSGYRRYSPRQLYAARLIVLLRRLDMPLSQIAEILQAPAPAAADRLAGYWTEVERRLAAQRELADRLVRSLAAETPEPAGAWSVRERDVPDQLVLSEQRYVTSAELPWILEATTRLRAVAERLGGPTGPRFVLFHGRVSEDEDGPVEVCVPIGPEAGGPATRREPAHREAYVPIGRGHFEAPRILSVYDAVHRYVRDRGGLETGPAREVYGYDDDPVGYVCDIAVPFR
jgi:DNA-binding transcriptional MerR regulator